MRVNIYETHWLLIRESSSDNAIRGEIRAHRLQMRRSVEPAAAVVLVVHSREFRFSQVRLIILRGLTLNDGASAGEFNTHSVYTDARISISSTSRSSEQRSVWNASATPTQVGRQPPAGYRCAGMYPATYGSSSKYRSCYSGQRASSLLRSPSFSSVLLRCHPLPPFSPLLPIRQFTCLTACLPACLPCLLHFLTCCPIFLGVFPRARSYLHPPCNAVLHVRLEIYSLYTAYTWSYLYFREDRPSAGQKFQIISLELLQLLK